MSKEIKSMTQATIVEWIIPLCSRQLAPRTKHFIGGRITEVDFLTLKEAAYMATNHAGVKVRESDFMRAAAAGLIEAVSIIRHTAKLMPIGSKDAGVIECEKHTKFPIPFNVFQGGEIRKNRTWRELYKINTDRPYLRYQATHSLHPSEPDFHLVEEDVRIAGYWVHALADAIMAEEGQKK